jgi:bacillithiol system protein YtxJ
MFTLGRLAADHPMTNTSRMSRIRCIDSLIDLESTLQASRERPVLLFKHSRSCGLSHLALEQLHAHSQTGAAHVRYAVVTVQTHRHISQAVADRLGIHHHTPQAILVRDGKPVWHATHVGITSETLTAATDRHVDIRTANGPRPAQ